ncbi:MAG: hypothetical protein ISN29_06220 [Gammaproteobacteria bacterium AqS3]|nr:hypothetical protein [Gammaproteobacteria bacterium AqS3]
MNCPAAFDIGISNGDAVCGGEYFSTPRRASAQETMESLLRRCSDLPEGLPLAVTGVGSSALPDEVLGHPLLRIPEFEAVGLGGQLAAQGEFADNCLVVSAGSGIALVHASGETYTHCGGTGAGGGALFALGRLLLEADSPRQLAEWAGAGDAGAFNLCIGDVFGGPLGNLPAEFTAVNFGKLIASELPADGTRLLDGAVREDVAAALTVMIAEVAAVLASAVAHALGVSRLVVIGNLVRNAVWVQSLSRIAESFQLQLFIPEKPGSAVARGALASAQKGG